MRKNCIAIIAITLALGLVGCGCKHQWKEATCEFPKTCELCGDTEGAPISHEWIAATCTEPKTCFYCKLTEGTPNGHNMTEATCTEPQTCTICGATFGDPLGHILVDTKQAKEATCAEAGLVEGTCTRCGKTLSEEVPLLDHSPGEQTISLEATYDAAGKKAIKCSACGAILEEETYNLTEEEKEEWYKDACEQMPYKDVARDPDDYVGRRVKITGEIGFIWEEASSEGQYSIYLVYTKSEYGFYFEEPYYVFVDNYDDSRILQGDVITFYGELDGMYSDFGENQPKLIAAFYDFKN